MATVSPRLNGNKKIRADEQALKNRHDWDRLQHLVNTDIEAALIAAVFMEPSIYGLLAQQVTARDFFIVFNGFVWWAFGELDSAHQGIDLLSVEQHLRAHNKITADSDAARLTKLTTAFCEMDAVPSYVRTITEAAMRRRMLQVADIITEQAYNMGADIEDVIDVSTSELYVATERRDLLKNTHITSGSRQLWDIVEARHERNMPDGVLTGFQELDSQLDALMPGELVMIGGDAGMGKTTLMLSIVMNILKQGKTCVLFSLEMSQMEIAQNLTAMIAKIPKSTLRRSLLTKEQLDAFVKAQGVISDLPLFVFGKDTYDDLKPLQFERQVRALQAQTPVDATFIDGLWLMSPDVATRERNYKDAQEITKSLIGAGERLKVPIVLMHQYAAGYSARVQSRKDIKRPNVGDFADGRHATRNPHVVIGMHRPDLYGGEDENAMKGLMQAFIIKNRNASGVRPEPVNMMFDPITSSYREPGRRNVDAYTNSR